MIGGRADQFRNKRPPMPVSHAHAIALTGTDQKVPGLLGVLARVRDPRKMRGQRFSLVFALAVAVICVLAGAKSFRRSGTRLLTCRRSCWPRSAGGRTRWGAGSSRRAEADPHFVHVLDAEALDQVIGTGCARWPPPDGWRACGRDGDRRRVAAGVADGQVELFAAMLHPEKGSLPSTASPTTPTGSRRSKSCWTR